MSKNSDLALSTLRTIAVPDGLTVTPREAEELNALHRIAEDQADAAKSAAFNAARAVAVSGLKLARWKLSIPHGQFQKAVKTHCEFSHRTATNYMRLAESVVHSLPPKERPGVLALASLPPEEITEDKLARLDSALLKGEKGLRALYIHFGLIKPTPADNLTGGGGAKRISGRNTEDEEDAAIEARRLVEELRDFVERSRHADLNKRERLTLVDELRAAASKIRRV